jgi:hypothetical protein
MTVDLDRLLDDLAAETEELVSILAPLGPDDYERGTPAEGWAIRDQVSHLAYFDESAMLALTDPHRFRIRAMADMSRGEDFADELAKDFRAVATDLLLPWLRSTREELDAVFRGVDPRTILFTGLTRDGTYLIENGEVRHPVQNLRWNESPIFMLNNIEMMGEPVRISSGESAGLTPTVIVPPLKVRDFSFTSLSDAV